MAWSASETPAVKPSGIGAWGFPLVTAALVWFGLVLALPLIYRGAHGSTVHNGTAIAAALYVWIVQRWLPDSTRLRACLGALGLALGVPVVAVAVGFIAMVIERTIAN